MFDKTLPPSRLMPCHLPQRGRQVKSTDQMIGAFFVVLILLAHPRDLDLPKSSSSRWQVSRPSLRKASRQPSQLLAMTHRLSSSARRFFRIFSLFSGSVVRSMWKFPQHRVCSPEWSGSIYAYPPRVRICRTAACWAKSFLVGQGSCQTKLPLSVSTSA